MAGVGSQSNVMGQSSGSIVSTWRWLWVLTLLVGSMVTVADRADGAQSSIAAPRGPAVTQGHVAPAASTTQIQLPGNRPNYVMSLMGAKWNAGWSRIATWQLTTTGVITERYWYWDQKMAPAKHDYHANRAPSGYVTKGCPRTCAVWTASTFKPGTQPLAREGRWSFDSAGNLHITWSSGFQEWWGVTSASSYSRLSLITHTYRGNSATYGSAFGSNAPLTTGATVDQIKASVGLRTREVFQDWDLPTYSRTGRVDFTAYLRCTGSPCLQGAHPQVWHTYYASTPASDRRKTYWYQQLPYSPECANPLKTGHTYQLLQILDDNNAFLGFVGTEASLVGRERAGSIIGHYVATRV